MAKDIFEKLLIRRIKNNESRTKVELCINSETELYNCFSIMNAKNVLGNTRGNTRAKINEDIIDYLMDEIKNIPKNSSLIIAVKVFEEITLKIDFIEKMIKENINEKLLGINRRIKKTNRRALVLTIIGMVLIGITHIFRFFEDMYSLNEFVIVMSWVFMWKATELFFFDRAKKTREKIELLKIYHSEMVLEKCSE